MSACHPAFERLSRVYGQVPSSPQAMSSYRPLCTSAHTPSTTSLKENAPLRVANHNKSQEQSTSASANLKRKASERDPSSLVLDGVVIISKKSKLSAGTLKSTQIQADKPAHDASNAADSSAWCHQCNRKRSKEDIIRCTVVERFLNSKNKTIRERECVNKYCRACLINRYNLDLDTLKSTPGCEFKCPRCRDACNCQRCRKSKGLGALGPLPKLPKNKVSEAAAPAKRPNVLKEPALSAPQESVPRTAALKPLPVVGWNSIGTRLSYQGVTDRIYIREFFLRFGDNMEPPLAKSHLDELAFLDGSCESDVDLHGWVTNTCFRALVISLLGLIAQNYPFDVSKHFKSAAKDVRAAGENLTGIWTALETLQNEILSSQQQSSIRDADANAYSFALSRPGPIGSETAGPSRHQNGEPHIAASHQMIPVLLSIIHHTLTTRIIREDIEQSGRDFKDWQPIVKDAIKRETERWEKQRESITAAKNREQQRENKSKRKLHKEQLDNINNCMKIVAPYHAPRFMSLGFDDDQREYFALSPCAAERDAASEYLEVAASSRPMRCKKRGRVLPAEERRELRDWAWFIGVYGSKPPGALDDRTSNGDSAVDHVCNANNDGPRWWGFWDPREIDKLAEWISIKSGLGGEDQSASAPATHKATMSPREAQLRQLIAGLKEYSSLLDWRINPDKCHLVKKESAITRLPL